MVKKGAKRAIPGSGVIKKIFSPCTNRNVKKDPPADEKRKLRDLPDDQAIYTVQKTKSATEWVKNAFSGENKVIKHVGNLMRINLLKKEFGLDNDDSDDSSDETKESLGDRNRMSTVKWFKQIMKHDESVDKIVDRFEEIYTVTARQTNIDPDAEPVNILILDGGGMKGQYFHYLIRLVRERFSKINLSTRLNIASRYFCLIRVCASRLLRSPVTSVWKRQ